MSTAEVTPSIPRSIEATAPAKPTAPIGWRQALLMALAVYPFITVYIMLIFPLTEGWAIWQRTALLVPIMVLTMVYLIAPQLQKRFGAFLMGRASPFARKELRG